MAAYTVKQIAEMLDTKQETVRRWIRDNKLHAVQASRKDGNVVTDEEFRRFLKKTPKYAQRLAVMVAAVSPGASLVALLGALATEAAVDYTAKMKSAETRILPEDAKEFILRRVTEMEAQVSHKTETIKQTESEIRELRKKIEAYKLLLDQNFKSGDSPDSL